jgi:hypothetical protein
VFDIIGFDRMLPVVESIPDALARLREAGAPSPLRTELSPRCRRYASGRDGAADDTASGWTLRRLDTPRLGGRLGRRSASRYRRARGGLASAAHLRPRLRTAALDTPGRARVPLPRHPGPAGASPCVPLTPQRAVASANRSQPRRSRTNPRPARRCGERAGTPPPEQSHRDSGNAQSQTNAVVTIKSPRQAMRRGHDPPAIPHKTSTSSVSRSAPA